MNRRTFLFATAATAKALSAAPRTKMGIAVTDLSRSSPCNRNFGSPSSHLAFITTANAN